MLHCCIFLNSYLDKPKKCSEISTFLVDIMTLNLMDESLATDIIMCVFNLFSVVDDPEQILLSFRQHIRAISLR